MDCMSQPSKNLKRTSQSDESSRQFAHTPKTIVWPRICGYKAYSYLPILVWHTILQLDGFGIALTTEALSRCMQFTHHHRWRGDSGHVTLLIDAKMGRNELWLRLIWAAACAAIITNGKWQDGPVESSGVPMCLCWKTIMLNNEL